MHSISKNNNSKISISLKEMQSLLSNKKKKDSKSKTSKQSVILVAAKKKGQQKQDALTKAARNGSYARKYVRAVLNPFSPASIGIRAPDGYCFPTHSRSVKGKFLISQNSSGSPAVAICANPVISVFDVGLFNTGISSLNGNLTLTSLSALNPSVYGATTAAGMVNNYESFRVAACGAKIRVVMPELTRTGTVTFAPFMSMSNAPGYRCITGTALTNANMYSSFLGGVLPAVAGTPTILELPGAFEMSINELSRHDIILPMKPITPVAQVFRGTDTTNTYDGIGGTLGTSVLSTVTGAVLVGSVDFTDLSSAAGFMGWFIVVDGVPTNAGNILQVEYVYHLEGMPSIASGAAAAPVADSVPLPRVTAADWAQSIRDIAQSPLFEVATIGLEAMGVGSSLPRGMRSIMNSSY